MVQCKEDPKLQDRHRQPADHRHTEEAEAQQVCGPPGGVGEHDRHIASGMQAMTPMMLVIEVKSARNPKASGPRGG